MKFLQKVIYNIEMKVVYKMGKKLSLVLFCTFIFLTKFVYADNEFRVAIGFSKDHAITKTWQEFADQVAEKTDGKVRFTLYPNAELYKEKDTPEALENKKSEAASTFIGRFEERVLSVHVLSLPFIYKNHDVYRETFSTGSEFRQTIETEIYEKYRVKVLWWQNFDRNIIIGKNQHAKLPFDMDKKKCTRLQ